MTARRLAFVVPLAVVASTLGVVTIPHAPHIDVRMLALRSPGTVRAPAPFRMVGVAWPAAERPPAGVRVRTSLDGRRWSAWNELDIAPDEGPDRGTHETQTVSTDPLWVGHARFVDVRWSGTMPPHAHVATVDPGPDPASPPTTAEASPGQPPIITRAQWGADEKMRRGPPEYAEPLQMVFVHHTATGNSYARSDSAAIVRSIYAYHVKSNGWNDIGYNFLVDKYGQIFEGRYGGVARSVVGAHTLGFNAHSAGIALIGTYGSAAPPAAAMSALRQLIAYRLDRSYVDPTAQTVMTSSGNPRFAAGTRVSLRTIVGHRDVYNTDCPGNALYAQLPSLRTAIAAIGDPKLYNPAFSLGGFTPNGDGVADTIKLSMRFSSTVAWHIDVVDSTGKNWASLSGTGTGASLTWNGRAGAVAAPPDVYRFVISAHNGHGQIRTTTAAARLWAFPDGTALRTPSGWLGIVDSGKLRHVVTARAMQSRYADAEVIGVSEDVRRAYPAGPDVGFREGSVVRVGNSIWIISDGTRRSVLEATLVALGYSTNSIIDTTAASLAPTPEGTPVSVTGGYPDGTALKSTADDEALVVASQTRPFLTPNVRLSYQIRDVDLAGPADSQVNQAQSNPPVGFRDGSLVQASGDPAVYVISDGLRRHITTPQTFGGLGYRTTNIRRVSVAELSLNPLGPPV